ncbi:MAG: O-antigen ligase family protein [Opitutales bacterium]|nr:O-antigen ligase family protein [Opitutales bacterium]
MIKVKRVSYKREISFIICVGILLTIFYTSTKNQTFNQLSIQTFEEVQIAKYLSTEKNLAKTLMISKGIKQILPFTSSNPNQAISVFLDFKNLYSDKYGSSDEGAVLLKNISKQIEGDPNPYLPTVPLTNTESWGSFLYFISQISVGFLAFHYLKQRVEIRKFALLLGISAVILAIIGIVQKLNYIPAENMKEIFGIWDTPEPRYFYASFTYKNHWSAFVILIISCLLALKIRVSLKYNFLNNYNLKNFSYILGLGILIISIPHSGSRSGVVVLLFLLILVLLKQKILRFKAKTFSGLCLVVVVFIIGGFFLNKETTKEMLSNTISQIQNKQPPLRLLLWKDLTRQISKKTFWGYGYNSYSTINPIFQSKEIREQRAIGLANAHNPYIPLIGYGHSDILEWISEFGWFGLSIFVLPVILLVCRNLILSKSIFSQIISIGGLSFLLFCCFDFPTRSPTCLIIFSVIVGISSKYTELSLNKKI